MKPLHELTRHYFGGGGNQAGAIQSAPVPLPAPPVTENNKAVLMAEHDVAQSNLMKKSIKNTIKAGDTGGFTPQSPLGSGGPATGYKAKLGG